MSNIATKPLNESLLGSVAKQMIAAALLVVLASLPLTNSASAQLRLQLGGGEEDYKRQLRQLGFTDIDTRKIGLSNSRFEACKDGVRYRIKIEWTGNIEQKRIGDCRQPIDQAQATLILQQQGYDRVNIEDRNGRFIVVACKGRERVRVQMSYFGNIDREQRLGRCDRDLSPEDVEVKLKENGYNRVRFTDRQLPNYAAVACFERDRYELVINGQGEIIEAVQRGRCQREASQNDLVRLLEERGYTRVRVLDARLPRYVVEACKDRRRVEVTLNRWGEVTNEERIGRCRGERLTVSDLTQQMDEEGFRFVSVFRQERSYLVRACKGNRYYQFQINYSGDVLNQENRGNCRSPAFHELAESYRRRGMSEIIYSVEACENGQRVKIEFDDFANRLGKTVVGTCDRLPNDLARPQQ